MGFNKGEWSELYTFLYLIKNPNLVVLDNNLKYINSNVFKVLEFILEDKNKKTKITTKTRYTILNKNELRKIKEDGIEKTYCINTIDEQNQVLLSKILAHKGSKKGTFDIKEIEPLIEDLLDGKKLKGASKVKGDLVANVFDNKIHNDFLISYNIKSNLGAPATLLNASEHTNFIFEVTGINDQIMQNNNLIANIKKGQPAHKTKLIDSCNYLIKNCAYFHFIKTDSYIFGNNLKLIDTNLAKILAKMLLMSYSRNEKDIKTLLSMIITDKDTEIYYKKKLGDFANAVTFGMRAGEKWNGENEVNGGIIIVDNKGEVYLLDLIYFEKKVNQYLIDNIKLDSPSSSRYSMFEIYKEQERYYFKLNLQIRFK